MTGASGLLGSKVALIAQTKGHDVISGFNATRPSQGTPVRLDITDESTVMRSVKEVSPDVIINTAALTDVDKCEEQPKLAFLVNTEAVSFLARAAQESNAFLVQVSTDYVFDGEKGQYAESDHPRPINKYGESKLRGEHATASFRKEESCVARTSVVFGWGRPQRPNAATYVVQKLSTQERVSIVRDQFSAPTLNTNLAEMLVELAERRFCGLIHTAGATRMNRYDFALGLAKSMGLDTALISGISIDQMQWKAKRPKDSSLNVARARELLNNSPLEIQRAYELFKEEGNESR